MGISGRFGFTDENELFVGRVAMIGFVASLIGEYVTGYGPINQLSLWTGRRLSPDIIYIGTLGSVFLSLALGLANAHTERPSRLVRALTGGRGRVE